MISNYKEKHQKYKKKYVKLKRELEKVYDLIIIGGGSAGVAAALESVKYGIKVAIFDYVEPSEHGSIWGIGGTCLNVGCIPKKFFYHAAQIGHTLDHMENYGWEKSKKEHNWNILINNIRKYIVSQNKDLEISLKKSKIDYFNMLVSFVDQYNIKGVDNQGKESYFTAKKFIIATGLRPKYPNIEGIHYGITSDDFFFLQNPPGETLIIGGSYISLEIGSFLKNLCYPVTIMVRSQFLRGFDRETVKIFIENIDLDYIQGVPIKIELVKNIKRVHYDGGSIDVNTVIIATGRESKIYQLGLDKIGVSIEDGKIVAPHFKTTLDHIYAIGDIVKDGIELTPVAIKSAKLLIQNLYESKDYILDNAWIPTSVFTVPFEYSSVGLSEEEGIKKYGQEIEVYDSNFKPLEYNLTDDYNHKLGYVKLICLKNGNIIGLHIVAPNAGEIIQGYVVAIKTGMTKTDFDNTIGIHPTISENILNLEIKQNKKSPKKC